MSVEQVIGKPPGDEYPLRAWLIEEGRMVDIPSYRILDHWAHNVTLHGDKGNQGVQDRTVLEIPNLKMIINSATERTLFVYSGDYYHVDTTLLHPTGIMGQRVCYGCDGHGQTKDIMPDYTLKIRTWKCPKCQGTGYVPDPIYQGDVVWWQGWICLISVNKCGCPRYSIDTGVYWPNIHEMANDAIILGSLFEFETVVKPAIDKMVADGKIKQAQVNHLAEQHRRLRL